MINIKRQIVSPSIARKVIYNGTNSLKYIVIHETSNESKGAGAQTHANLQSRGFSASWHYSVGSDGIYQSFEDTAQTWHAGSPSYNKSSIGIEMCVNSDGDYKKTVDTTIELVKHLMKKHNILPTNVIPHQKTSTWNKICPRYLLGGSRYINWNTFIKRLGGESNVSVSKPSKKPVSKPKQPTQSSYRSVSGNWTGQTLVNGVKGNPVKQLQTKLANNNPPFYPNKGAKNNGIDSYFGSDTANSVKRFQTYYGLTVDSKAGKQVYAKLGGKPSKPSKKPSVILRHGSRGSAVKQLQTDLSSIYFYPNKKAKNNGIDSIFGNDTESALIRFQSMHGLKQDGVFGSSSRKALNKAMSWLLYPHIHSIMG